MIEKYSHLLLIIFTLIFALSFLSGCTCDNDDDDTSGSSGNDDDDNDNDDNNDDTASDDDDDNNDDDNNNNDDDDTSSFDPGEGFYWKPDVYVQYLDGGSPGEEGTSMVIGPDDTKYVAAAKGGVLILYTQAPGSTTWTKERIAYLAENPSLAIDSDGFLHVSYNHFVWLAWKGGLYYATNKSGSWQNTLVDDEQRVGQDSALALDADGNAHISYLESYYDKTLRYATNASGTWVIETILTEAEVGYGVGEWSDIVVDVNGNVHMICTGDTDNYHYTVFYITNKNGLWEYEPAVGAVTSSLAVDVDGFAHIAYGRGFGLNNIFHLTYATNRTGAWTHKVVDWTETNGWDSDIILDDDGNVHIAYQNYEPHNAPAYATNSGGFWTWELCDAADTEGRSCSLALDSAGTPHMVHHNFIGPSLRYSKMNQGTWTGEVLDQGGVPTFRNLSLTNDGFPGFSFTYNVNGIRQIRYVRMLPSGQWICDALESGDDMRAAYGTPLAWDSQGNAHLLYFKDSDYEELRYATQVGGEWIIQTLTDESDGNYVGVHVDANDMRTFGFSDDGVIFLIETAQGWETLNNLDPLGAMGKMKILDSGDTYLFYYDSTYGFSFGTKMAGDTQWNIIPTIFADDNGSTPALAIALDGTPHLSRNYDFPDSPYDEVQYCTKPMNGTEQCEFVADSQIHYIDMDVDAGGFAHILNFFTYTSNYSGSWQTYEEIIPGIMGYIAVDDNDMVHVIFSNASGLWYAHFPAGLTDH